MAPKRLPYAVKISLDGKPALRAIKEFTSLLPKVLNGADNSFLCILNRFVKLGLPGFVKRDVKTVTAKTGNITAIIEPSNFFLNLLSALRANDINYNIIRRRLIYHINKTSKAKVS